MNSIIFDNMSYAYPGGDAVLKNINAIIPPDSFTILTGPEGAGKTTFCLAIAGAVPGYFGGRMAGSVTVGGVKTTDIKVADLAERVGIVLADYDSQLLALTVAEEVAFGLENRGAAPETIAAKIREVLALVGLSGNEHAEVAGLSGGQRQRLAIAGMLVADPDILVLDEPASALDPEGTAELYRLLGELNRKYGKTVIVVEHCLRHVLPYANNLLVLQQGCLQLAGHPEDLLPRMLKEAVYAEAVPAEVKTIYAAAAGVRKEETRSA
ncbi:MAG: energy-coupling factor ABC transporter ATP-binding protein [Negativicutes bacterium]|nr:energy-coupling factor ABC transporter ATP-binding protein [Negativicutes bacterium]